MRLIENGTMTEAEDASENVAAKKSRVSFERLRERTDELELLISGLSMFALFAFPGWLFERYLDYYTLLPLVALAGALMALPMVSTVAYTLAICLMLHLSVRAYWVGLIGLSAIFPDGIRWERASHLGPLARERLRAQLPSMEQAIAKADRLASLLFSMITLVALSLCWLGLVGTLLFTVGASIGSAYGHTNAVIVGGASAVALTALGSMLLVWLLDAQLASRWPALQRMRWFRALVRVLTLPVRVMMPARLIAPVRLTLQTNTHPRLFTVAFLILVILVPILGSILFQSRFDFDPLGTQRFATSADVTGGLRSASYESLRTPQDRVRGAAIIPAPVIESAWLPLFLPYVPIRDGMILEQRCSAAVAEDQEDAELSPQQAIERADRAALCLRKIWALELDGAPAELQGMVISERRDLGYRGLSGWIDLRGSKPGPRELRVTWRPAPEQDLVLDDYLRESAVYRIPFLWSPEFAAEPGN